MSDIKVRLATPRDGIELAPRLRAIDMLEVKAAAGDVWSPEAALAQSIKLAESPTAVLVDGVVDMIYGVTEPVATPRHGVPWMLTAGRVLQEAPRQFLRGSRDIFTAWTRRYVMMGNWVHAENHQAKRWLEWLGFTIRPPSHTFPGGHPMQYFFWRAP